MIRLLKWTSLLLILACTAMAVASRTQGIVIKTSEGRLIGYHAPLKQWCFNSYPNYPARLDGPYVIDSNGERTVLAVAAGAEQATRTPLRDQRVQVPVDNTAQAAFEVALRDQHPRSTLDFAQPSRLLVLSDLEGEFDAGVRLLQGNGVIDADLHWSYGDGAIVLIGDLVDRGDNVVPLLWLIYRLEAEARAAGGQVHYVLGNHENYLLQGVAKDAAKKYLASARVSAMTPASLWSTDSELGRWLRSKPVAIRIGRTLFMHGGLSAEVLASGATLAQIDALAARYIGTRPPAIDDPQAALILGSARGVLWYRGLAMSLPDMPKVDAAHLERALVQFDVDRIAVGHTLVAHVGHDFGGRVLRSDTPHADGVSEAILIRGPELFAVDAGGNASPLVAFIALD